MGLSDRVCHPSPFPGVPGSQGSPGLCSGARASPQAVLQTQEARTLHPRKPHNRQLWVAGEWGEGAVRGRTGSVSWLRSWQTSQVLTPSLPSV